MTTQKQPEHGQYWTCKGTRVRIVGLHSGGDYVCELNDGSLSLLPIGEYWQHLPDCDSWTWQPEVWPKWYVPKQSDHMSGHGSIVAYYRRDTKNSGITVHVDGSQFTWQDWHNGHMKLEVTEAEALARVTPAETFPQYWTTSDSTFAYLRQDSKNQWCYVLPNGLYWFPSGTLTTEDRTQLTKEQADALLDKPQESPPQPSPKRVPVRLWREYCTGNVIATIDRIDDLDPIDLSEEADQIKHDANGFYVEVQP